MVTQFMQDRDPHFTRYRLRRLPRSLQWTSKQRDTVWQNEVVIGPTVSQRRALIEPEQCLIITAGEPLSRSRIPAAGGQLGFGRLVLDDDLDVIEHRDDLGGEVVQRTGDQSLEPLPPGLLDSASYAVLHNHNDTSFRIISPV